ncbi:MAG: acyl-CoA dehydrogenase, partial [Aquificota bacterium]
MFYDVLLTGEEKALRDEVRRFVKEEVSPEFLRKMDADDIEYPREFVEKLGKQGLLGLRFPEEYGGRGMAWTGEIAALEEMGVLGTALSCAFAMPSIVGEALYNFGTPEQKEKYLKSMLLGKLIAAEALTEPRGGSDFFGATTTARRDGDCYILNGQKRFIVGAEGADLFFVYAKTDPEAPAHKSLSAFIVERDMGVEVKKIYGLMGTRGGGTGRIVFRDVKVPRENLVGEENGAAAIFNRMMIPERLTSAGGALGMARAALDVAVRYSTRRKAFGRPIREFQGVSFKVADAMMDLDAARGLVYLAAKMADSGQDARRLVSEAKRFSTEMAWRVVNHAMQILGGIGYTQVFPVERLLR